MKMVAKKGTLKRRLILLLAAALDEAIDTLELLTSPYKNLGYYPSRRWQETVRDFLKTGLIEKVIKRNGEVVYRITSRGELKLIREIPLVKMAVKGWDKKWRAIIFDIPEKQRRLRNRLRKHLKSLGLGMLQKSVWITPFNIASILEDFLEEQNLSEYALVLVSRALTGEEGKELARKVWRLDDLHDQYLDFIKKWDRAKITEKDLKQWVEEGRDEFFELLLKDPFLPKELLPDDWLASKARRIFSLFEKELRRGKV